MLLYTPVSIPVGIGTGPVLVRCWQHRTSTSPVPARNGMFAGIASLNARY